MASAGVKRRVVSGATGSSAAYPKKQKTAPISRKSRIPQPALEVETDSDPIVESDTTENSGNDDGVSWPSDDDHEEEGGVQLPSDVDGPGASKKSTNGNDSTNKSKEAHAKQKATAQERKSAKPNADIIARSKKIWERLRRQSHVPLQERKKLVAELFSIITGRVKDFVLKHDAGRVIQTALKYGSLEQRKMIARELKGEYRQLAESKYAKFTIGKILSNGDSEIRDLVVPEFFGNVRRLIKHPEASWILDDIYRGAASKKQKAQLLKEWYGAEYAIFQAKNAEEEDGELKGILDGHPEKRAPVMRYLFQMIDQLVQKKTTGFTMLHDAMFQYYSNVISGSEEANDFIELLKGDEEGDLMKNLAFTPSGARLVSLALANSSAKDRKLLLRVYKSVIETMAFDVNARRVLISALDVIDDTVLTTKFIYGELIPKEPKDADFDKMMDYAINLNSRGVVLYPFRTNLNALLTKEDLLLLQEVQSIRKSTSKKDPRVRIKELGRYLSQPLINFIASRAGDLIQTSFGCLFMQDVLLGAEGDKGLALSNILSLLKREDLQDFMTAPHVGRMLKSFVLSGRFNPETKSIELCEPSLGFADMLWKQISKEVINWATGPNASVIIGLLDSQDFSKKDELKTILRKRSKELQQAAEHERSSSGETSEKKGKKGHEDHGNKGTRLILKILEQ